jgi:hypothetical protein
MVSPPGAGAPVRPVAPPPMSPQERNDATKANKKQQER